jgi:hypothetical protein
MQIVERVTPEQLRSWKRWISTLEAMLWVLQTAPLRAERSTRPVNGEDRSLRRFLRRLIARGRKETRDAGLNWEMSAFEDDYQCAVHWFHELQHERETDWKLKL